MTMVERLEQDIQREYQGQIQKLAAVARLFTKVSDDGVVSVMISEHGWEPERLFAGNPGEVKAFLTGYLRGTTVTQHNKCRACTFLPGNKRQ